MFKRFFTSRSCAKQVFPDLIGAPDHCMFDLTNGYCVFAVVLDGPTKDELYNFRHGPKDFRLSIFEDVMYFTLKAGKLDWNEAPFSPQLVTQADVLNAIDIYTKEVEILLVDSKTGIAKYCESYSLDKIMSAAIKIGIEDAMQREFDNAEYREHIQTIQELMTSGQIAQLASARQILPEA